MNKKKKGELLEWMVYILEQSLATTPSSIQKNYKLADQHGIEREIDIYVEASVNGKILKYAFECKNYKKGVQLSHVTDFHSKIANIGIKGFFVTTSNYQSGAIDKANALQIDLLLLKKREASPDDIKGLLLIQKRFKVSGIKIFGNIDPAVVIKNDDRIENCPKCSKGIIDNVEQNVIPLIQQQLDNGIEAIHPEYKEVQNISKTLGEENAKNLGMMVNFYDSSITHKGNKIEYNWMQINLKVWQEIYEKLPVNNNMFSYLGFQTNDILASFSISEFLIGSQSIIVGITVLKDGKRKVTFTDSFGKESKISETVCIGSIDELGISSALKENTNGDNC